MSEAHRAYRDEYDRSVPTWLATEESGQLALFVDQPVGPVRGVTVIVMPIGREYVCTYRGLRVLADALRSDGQLVIRCALRGEGNSSPLGDALPAEAWTQDVNAVVAYAHSLTGTPVTLVGVRLAAGVACCCDSDQVGLRILLEPVAGRHFLRQQQALRSLSAMINVPVVEEGAEIAGRAYTAAQAASFANLKLAAANTVLVEDEDKDASRTFYGVDPEEGTVPHSSIDRIRQLVLRHDETPIGPLVPVSTIECTVDGQPVRATWVEVGPHHLPGVLTEPVGVQSRTGVVFAVSGTEPMDGPTGLWAELAWPLAAAGNLVLRAERWGQGELMVRGRDTAPNPYNDDSVADTVEAIRFVRARVAGEVVAVGLCAGASLMLRASSIEPVDRQLAVNDQAWVLSFSFYEHLLNPTKLRQALVKPTTTSVRSLKTRQALRRTLRTARNTGATYLPQVLRRRLSQRGWVADPYTTLMDAPSGSSVSLVFGPLDELLWQDAGGPAAVRHLPTTGPRVGVETDPDVDHALLSQRARRWVHARALAFTRPQTRADQNPVHEPK